MGYIIFDKGMDYNDEIFSVGGDDATVHANGYESLDDAKAALREKYVKLFEADKEHPDEKRDWSLSVGQFSYDGEEPAWELAEQFGLNTDRWSGPHYHQIINTADAMGIDWLPYVPAIYEIVEVTFS